MVFIYLLFIVQIAIFFILCYLFNQLLFCLLWGGCRDILRLLHFFSFTNQFVSEFNVKGIGVEILWDRSASYNLVILFYLLLFL